MMKQKFFFALFALLPIFAWHCHSGESDSAGSEAGVDTSASSGTDPMQQLQAQAIDESDIHGRLQATVKVLQAEFTRSGAAVPAHGQVTVSIDADCLLTLSNYPEKGRETRVSLKELDPNGFRLLPDLKQGDLPGLRIQTLEDRPVVAVREDGQTTQQSELEIFLSDRQGIERITPYMLQALNICHGVSYPD